MKKFVVGIVDLFENNLEMTIVESDSKENALMEVLSNHGQKEFDSDFPVKGYLDDMIDYMFNCDTIVNVIEI